MEGRDLTEVELEWLRGFKIPGAVTTVQLHGLALLAVKEIERRRLERGPQREYVSVGYEQLAAVHDEALRQAQSGKGRERHSSGEPFHDQQIVQLGEWMGGSTVFAIGQACKKALESTRIDDARARAELLGAINYLAAAVILLDRRNKDR